MGNQMVRFNKDSHLQRIKASYLDGDIQLSEYEEKLAEQLRFIYSHRLKNKFTKQQVIDRLRSEYPDVSQATAYRRYNMSMHLFGEIDQVNEKAEKLIIAENYLHIYQQQLKDRNWSEAKKTMDSYAALFDFSKSENDIDPDKIKANNYRISIPRELLAHMKELSSKGVVDMNMSAEDVDFEEIADGESTE